MSDPHQTSGDPRPGIIETTAGLLGLDKPAGLNVFGPESLATWLISQRPGLASVGPADEPAIVHRLDRDTSGLVLAATDPGAYHRLRAAFSSGRVDKRYLALVEGRLEGPIRIDLPLGSRYRRSRRVQVDRGRSRLRGVRPAVTEVEPIEVGQDLSLCRIRILTGLRHQIRAHLAHLGHPVAGDGLYGARLDVPGLGGRHFLHAQRIQLDLEGGPRVDWRCPLGPDLQAVLAEIGLSDPIGGD